MCRECSHEKGKCECLCCCSMSKIGCAFCIPVVLSYRGIKKMKRKFEFVLRDKQKVIHENLNDHEKVECPICNREIQPYWEPRYNGVRATCNVCGINWQES